MDNICLNIKIRRSGTSSSCCCMLNKNNILKMSIPNTPIPATVLLLFFKGKYIYYSKGFFILISPSSFYKGSFFHCFVHVLCFSLYFIMIIRSVKFKFKQVDAEVYIKYWMDHSMYIYFLCRWGYYAVHLNKKM